MTPMATSNSQRLLGVLTSDDIAELSARNRARAAQAIAKMGPRWCCHRSNSPRRPAEGHQLRRSTDWPALTVVERLPEPLRQLLNMGRPL
jgi:hypothetical protein